MRKKLGIIIFSILSTFSTAQNVPKQGGICFRIDDNSLINQYRDYINIFEKYNQKFTFAMNLGLDEFSDPAYVDSIRVFQDLGHELLDHTPNHRTNYFTTQFDTNYYKNHAGVDHIIDTKICLKHEIPDSLFSEMSDTATVRNDTVFFTSKIYNEITKNYYNRYIYFPSLSQLVLVKNYHNNTAVFTDKWDDSLNLGVHNGIKFHIFQTHRINLTPEALELLADETVKLSELYNLESPTVWIHPGGIFPNLHANKIKGPFETVGYSSAATYPQPAEKVYNEYNPNNDRQFAMQWGDFVEDRDSFDKLKGVIADGIAKHRVLIGHGHWYSEGVEKWNNYIAKNDSLLEWATNNSIPIKTYSEWTDLLYNKTPNPYENIMPPLNVDIDSNNIPDGYGNLHYPISDLTGVLVEDPSAPDSIAYRSLFFNNYKQITHIIEMGGIEKGENDFSIWTKGEEGNSIKVTFSAAWPGTFYQEFILPANDSNWTKYDLSQSTNGNTNLIIPDTLSEINIDIYHQTTNPKPIWISGMYLAKKIEIDSLKLTVLNDNTIEVGDSIFVEVSLFNEFGDSALTSYQYEIIFPDSLSAQLLTTGNLSFKNNFKDTIIVKDNVSEVIALTAQLKNDTTVNSKINIPVVHSQKFVDLKIFLEGPYNSSNRKMNNGLSSRIPLISPYTEAPDTLTSIPENMVDWVLVTLRKDVDSENPNPQTSVNVISKSAIIDWNGKIKDPKTHDNIGLRINEGYYYIEIKHRNHLPVMSSQTIHF